MCHATFMELTVNPCYHKRLRERNKVVAQHGYCPRCGKEVEAIEITAGTRGSSATLRCIECGQVLAELPDQSRRESADEKMKLSRVVAAGYSDVQNNILIAALVRNQYTDIVDHCANGEEFLRRMTSLLHKKEPPKLIILEVNMPIMNGINSALCLRSIEKGIGGDKIPILFFTQKDLDDMFTRAIKFLTPAKYVPLPHNPDTETFRKRADQIAELLKMGTW